MEFISNPVIDFTDSIGKVNKVEWFNNIINYVMYQMDVEDYLLVYDFGRKGNQKLYIYIDDDYDIKIETDIWANDDGDDGSVLFVDRTYIERDKEELINTLERLWYGYFEGID